MSPAKVKWLTVTEASTLLGVHPATLRRWADAGNIQCFRTPGGHRRFSAQDLKAWTQRTEHLVVSADTEIVIQEAISFTKREMAVKRVSEEAWYTAFDPKGDRQQLRDSGRRMFWLALQYLVRARSRELILHDGRRLGAGVGEQAALRGVSLEDTMRAFFFFRESLLHATQTGPMDAGQAGDLDGHVHRELRHFMDDVMYACLAGYDAIRYSVSQSTER